MSIVIPVRDSSTSVATVAQLWTCETLRVHHVSRPRSLRTNFEIQWLEVDVIYEHEIMKAITGW